LAAATHAAPKKRRDHVHKKVNVFDAIQSVRHASFCRGRHSPMDSLAAAWAAAIASGEGAPRSGVASTSPGYAAFARALPGPGRRCHSTLPLTVVGCHWLSFLGIYTVILLSLLSFSVEMKISPAAGAAAHEEDRPREVGRVGVIEPAACVGSLP
jgi:hypothetical protein